MNRKSIRIVVTAAIAVLTTVMATGANADFKIMRDVNCDRGMDVQRVLDRNVMSFPMEIRLAGTCDGFTIERDNVSITARDDDACPGATVSGRIEVFNSQRVELSCLAVTSSENGIDIVHGSRASITENLITGASAGVYIDHGSSAQVFDNEITGSTSVGIFVNGSSYGEIRDNTLASSFTDNFSQIFVTGSSAADVSNNIITASGGSGVASGFASNITAGGNNISGTASAGIMVEQNAHLFLSAENTVGNSALEQAIYCGATGSLRVDASQTITTGFVVLMPGCEITNYSGVPFPP